jgi:hypothetical protein
MAAKRALHPQVQADGHGPLAGPLLEPPAVLGVAVAVLGGQERLDG